MKLALNLVLKSLSLVSLMIWTQLGAKTHAKSSVVTAGGNQITHALCRSENKMHSNFEPEKDNFTTHTLAGNSCRISLNKKINFKTNMFSTEHFLLTIRIPQIHLISTLVTSNRLNTDTQCETRFASTGRLLQKNKCCKVLGKNRTKYLVCSHFVQNNHLPD